MTTTYLLLNPSTSKENKPVTKSTISFNGLSYLVHRPDGAVIPCHNYATANWYVRNPQAK